VVKETNNFLAMGEGTHPKALNDSWCSNCENTGSQPSKHSPEKRIKFLHFPEALQQDRSERAHRCL